MRMTRDEIINEIKNILSELDNGEDAVSYLTQNDVKWLKENIKALEQEPCEDVISRQAVLEYIEGSEAELGHSSENELVCQGVKELPSVTPQQKMGHWKFVQRGKHIDICCPNCGYQRVKGYAYNYTVDQISEQDMKDFFSNSNMNFCEKCGAKMESEG